MLRPMIHAGLLRGCVVVGALVGSAGCPGEKGGATEGATEAASEATTEAMSTTAEPTTGGTTEVSSSGSSGSSGTTGGAPAECACIPDDPEEGDWGDAASLPTCGETLCPVVDGAESFDLFVLGTPDALTCALTALRDRTPGVIRWTWTENGGQFSDDGYVLIQADGTGVRRSWGASDLSYGVSEALHGALPVTAMFEACMMEVSDWTRFRCLMDVDIGAPTVVCDEGWGAEAF